MNEFIFPEKAANTLKEYIDFHLDRNAIIQNKVPERLKEAVRKLVCEWYKPIIPIEGAYELIKE